MATPPDFSISLDGLMQGLPMHTVPLQKAFRIHSKLGERVSQIALQAADRSTGISAQWAQKMIVSMGQLASVRGQPADHALAASAFAATAVDLANQHMAAFADVAMGVQMDMVDLMMTAGRNISENAQVTDEQG